MAVNVQANATINEAWTNFKAVAITNKALLIQYDDDGTVYTIFAFDTDNIAYVCTIWKGTVPDPVIAGGYTQSQNNTDKTDFETNYKPTANSKLGNAAAQFGTWSVNDVQASQVTGAWTSSTTVNTAISIVVTNYSTATFTLNQGSTITGGVVTFEVSDTIAGTNWYPISVISSAGATVPSSTYTLQQSVNASFQTNVAGYVQVRARLSTVISGTGTVNIGVATIASAAEWQQAVYITDASHGPVAVKAASTAPVAGDPSLVVTISPNSPATAISGTITANQGTANTVANSWTVEVTDGTHGPATVKAASTAAAAADPSLVVGLSPNSPLPSGTNVIGALSANQSVNVAQVAGSSTSTAATGVQKVGVVGGTGTSLESTAGVLDHNLKNVANSAVVTAATGVQKVGVVGGTGTSFETTAGVMDHNLKNIGNAAVATLGSGEQKVAVEGLAASGAALSGNPVLSAGSDGVDARSMLTDTSGRQVVVGAAADAATAAGNPVMIAGLDASGNAREPRVESTFRQLATVEPPWSAVMGSIGSSPIAEMAFGYVNSSAKTIVPVRATTYTQISGAPVQVSVKSSSASDASASTGTKTITITYLTTGAVRKTETITMNGTTAVNSVNSDYAFIEKVVSSTAGTNRTNVGTITVFSGTGGTGTALCSIAVGDGRTNLCHHYVTSGKTCYITGMHFSSNGGSIGTVFLQITNPAETDVLETFCSQFRTSGQTTTFEMTFTTPIKVPQSDITNGSLIIAYVIPDATTATTWWVSFSYVEV